MCKNTFAEGGELDEREIEQYIMNPTNDRFVQKMSRYLLFFRMANMFEWEVNPNNEISYQVINKTKAVHTSEGSTKTIASKNVFKGNVRVELICNYHTNNGGWYTIG